MAARPLTRRSLLTSLSGAAALSGLAGLGVLPAVGGPTSIPLSRRLLVVLVSGGWDVTFALDPKLGIDGIDGPAVDATGLDGDVESIETYGDFRIAVNDSRRPAVRALFETYGSRLCVVNGLWVGNLAHFEARGRMLTGSVDRFAPDVATIFGVSQPEAPIASVDLSGVGRVGPYADRTAIFGQEGQLAALVDPARRMPAGPSSPPGYRGTSLQPEDRAALQSFLAARTESDPRRAMEGGEHLLAARAEAMSRAERLVSLELPTGELSNLRGQILVAVDLLSRGVTPAVTVTCSPTFDTHTDQLSQHPRWNNLCSDLKLLLDLLDETGLFADTTVAVISDFGRMPQRNYYGGTDHFPHTSAMFFGAGIAGGRLIGATNDRLQSLPLSLQTGELSESGSYLRPNNLAAGLLELLGVDPEQWLPGSEPFRAFRA